MIKGFNEIYKDSSNKFKLYHGSNVKIAKPKIIEGRFKKDFGHGFYLTDKIRQAEKFTRKFQRWGESGIVNIYEFDTEIYNNLSGLKFEQENEEWLDFIVKCRNKNISGTPHNYDWVEGPMADDQVWDFVEDFMEKRITREAFWSLCKFKYPTHQICLNTEKALGCIKFIESYEV